MLRAIFTEILTALTFVIMGVVLGGLLDDWREERDRRLRKLNKKWRRNGWR